MRKDGRTFHQLREIVLTPDYVKRVPGSVLIEQGETRVVCTATCEYRVPQFLRGGNKGWVMAEYGMLPGSTGHQNRMNRERQRVNNRSVEIQRFIGRALRTTFNLKKINGITIHVDSDVIQADGGTRCASINGCMIVLAKALKYLVYENKLPQLPDLEYIGAVSIGVKNNDILVDLNYYEDSEADADINIVSTESGNIVEVQAFGEERNIPLPIFQEVVALGVEKNKEIIRRIRACVDAHQGAPAN